MVVDASSLWVFGQVYEKNADLVAVGQPARFDTVDAAVDGKIDWVASQLDGETRTLKVRALINNPDRTMKAGQYGDLTITRQVADPVPLVPVDAVQTINGQTHVFVPGDTDGEYRAQEVETGEEANGLIEIKSGLRIGASVVTSGAFDLKSALTASGRSARTATDREFNMIERLIDVALRNRLLVLVFMLGVAGWGCFPGGSCRWIHSRM